MKAFCLLLAFFTTAIASASDFTIEKQKLKLSLEYENFVDTEQDEIRTSGLKATYLLHAKSELGRVYIDLDYQTGLKTNFYRDFNAGDLPAFIWSNRANASFTLPMGRFYIGATLYFRDKIFSQVPPEDQFVDIFGGVGFHQWSGAFQGGCKISSNWEASGNVQASNIQYTQFEESNSHWIGASMRLTRKISSVKLNIDYRIRSIDFNRPVSAAVPLILVSDPVELQHDRFQEFGAGVEFYRMIYFSGGYYYQINDSNNPGFAFRNHRISILLGTELTKNYQLQAYGILQRQNFEGEDGFLPYPVLVDESDNNTMAISLVRAFGKSREVELGMQRYTYNSSFSQLNASKYILYVAYNFRF